jgi:LAO/AO transport system kinase
LKTTLTNRFEIISLCEYSGFDVVLLETVGVGQSEIQVSDLCDVLILLVAPAQGDELQGIKKGIVEVSDLIIVNKADGDLKASAMRTKAEYRQAVHLTYQTTSGAWNPKVMTCSALQKENLDNVWNEIENCKKTLVSSGIFDSKRVEQREKWMWKQIHEEMVKRLNADEEIKKLINEMLGKVRCGEISPRIGAHSIIDQYLNKNLKK